MFQVLVTTSRYSAGVHTLIVNFASLRDAKAAVEQINDILNQPYDQHAVLLPPTEPVSYADCPYIPSI